MLSLKIKKGFDQHTVALSVLAMQTPDVCGVYLQHKGTIRLLLSSPVVQLAFDIVVGHLKEYCYEISSDDNRFKWTAPRENNLVLIKRSDCNPITISAYSQILSTFKTLNCDVTHSKLDASGSVSARMRNASFYHEFLIGPWVILWRGAEGERKIPLAGAQPPEHEEM